MDSDAAASAQPRSNGQRSAKDLAAAMYEGRLSWRGCFEWARRAPDEVPKLHGEFWFIAA